MPWLLYYIYMSFYLQINNCKQRSKKLKLKYIFIVVRSIEANSPSEFHSFIQPEWPNFVEKKDKCSTWWNTTTRNEQSLRFSLMRHGIVHLHIYLHHEKTQRVNEAWLDILCSLLQVVNLNKLCKLAVCEKSSSGLDALSRMANDRILTAKTYGAPQKQQWWNKTLGL